MDALELRKFMCDLLNVYSDWTMHIMENYIEEGNIDDAKEEQAEFINKVNQFCAAFPGIGDVMTKDVVDMISLVISFEVE